MASVFGDPLAPSLCDQCGNAADGTIRCNVHDNKNLCRDCFQGLPQAKRQDMGNQEWVCGKHFTRKVAIFCDTCQRGCCKECADVHKGHNMMNVYELVQEIRRDLTEQLQEVGARAEELSQLRQKIERSSDKIEEAPKLVHEVVEEIKEEVVRKLQEDVHRINWETQHSIIHLEMRRNAQLKLVKEKADLDIQRIEEIKQDCSISLLKDAEPRKCKIKEVEMKLLVGQQACESANLEIKSLLDSTPENVVFRGRQLSCLVKASSAFQCQSDVINACRKAEADLPKLTVRKDDFFYLLRPFSPLVKFVLCVATILYFANAARGLFRDEFISLLSSKSMTVMVSTLLCFPLFYAKKCIILMVIFHTTNIDSPFTWQMPPKKKLKTFIKTLRLALEFEIFTILFLILVSYPMYLLQLKSVSANIVSIISVLQSCSFIYYMIRNSKIFRDYSDYVTGPYC